MKRKRFQFERLEAREMFDGAGIFGPMPLDSIQVAEPVESETCVPCSQSIDLSGLVGPVVKDLVPLVTTARNIISSDTVVVEENFRAPINPKELIFGSYDVATQKLEMNWTPVDSNLGYVIHYSIDNGQTWRVSGYTSANQTSREALSVLDDLTYIFRVAAFNEYGQSYWTKSSWNYEESLKPDEPGSITFNSYDSSAGKLTYSWGFSQDSDVKYYQCEYSYNGNNWKLAGNVKSNRNYRTASGVWEGSTVYFRVCSKNSDSVCSDWVTAVWNSDFVSELGNI